MRTPDPRVVEKVLTEYDIALFDSSVIIVPLVFFGSSFLLTRSLEIATLSMVFGGIAGPLAFELGRKLSLSWAESNKTKSFSEKRTDGEKLVEQYKNYPACGDYIVTTFSDLYSPEGTDELRLVFDMPRSNHELDYEFPYNWDEDSSGIVEVFKKRDIEPDNLTKIIGKPVLVKTKDNSSTKFDVYNVNKPEDRIKKLHNENKIDESDVDSEQIKKQFEIDLPWETTNEDESEDCLTADNGAVYTVVDSVQ